MSDHHDDEPKEAHERPVDPFPTAFPPPPVSLFPPVYAAEPAPAPAEVSPLPVTPADPPSDWNAGADAHDLPTAESLPVLKPLAALGRFAFPPGPPLDDDGLGARDRRWASRSIVFAALFLLIFNAASPQNWSRLQPPGWGTETVRRMSDVWAEQIALTGADRPRQWVHDVWRDWQEMRFSGSEPPAV